jgi:hypothetical protein
MKLGNVFVGRLKSGWCPFVRNMFALSWAPMMDDTAPSKGNQKAPQNWI